MAMGHVVLSLSLPKATVDLLDLKRGSSSRSAFVAKILARSLSESPEIPMEVLS